MAFILSMIKLLYSSISQSQRILHFISIQHNLISIIMEQDTYVYPKHPAGVDPVSIDLFSQHNLDSGVRQKLENCLLHSIPKNQQTNAKALILGARTGLTAQLMLPGFSNLDLVDTGDYYTILHERFVKAKNVSYFAGKEGFIGEDMLLEKPKVGQTKVRVISAEDFTQQVHPHYDIVVLQNCIINEKINLVKELIKIEHDYLITMLVPGYIIHEPFFPFICSLQKEIISTYYQHLYHQSIQSKRVLTARRAQVFYYEVFGWKKLSNAKEAQTQVHKILEEAAQKISFENNYSHPNGNPYETGQLVNMYLNFHYGPNSLGVENYPAACARLCIDKAQISKLQKGRALDLGCAVGRTSIQLAKEFKQVVGIDFSNAFIKAADAKLSSHEEVANKVKFVVGDACNLSPSLGKFNLIFGGNLIDRLPDPFVFLNSIGNFLEPQGLLIMTSPYSWLQQYTPKDKWVGGYWENNKPLTTNEGLTRALTKVGFEELCPCENLRFSIKDNDWVFQYTLAWATFWRKQ